MLVGRMAFLETPASASPLVVIGGSAGGIEALRGLLPTLSPTCEAAIAIALHRLPFSNGGQFERVVRAGCALPVRHAEHGELLKPGQVLLSPPNVHLTIVGNRAMLSSGPKVNRSRPSVDALFQSAALSPNRPLVGIVLSGMLHDGAAGLRAVRACGGLGIVQDPLEARFAGMPRSAIASGADAVFSVTRMAPLIERFTRDASFRLLVESDQRGGGEDQSYDGCPAE